MDDADLHRQRGKASIRTLTKDAWSHMINGFSSRSLHGNLRNDCHYGIVTSRRTKGTAYSRGRESCMSESQSLANQS
jgi:hypothetical protein